MNNELSQDRRHPFPAGRAHHHHLLPAPQGEGMKDHTPPAYIVKMSEQIQTLQARIAVRLTIAKQDAQAGDTWAMRRNLSEAASMEAMLHDKINSTSERKAKQK